MQLMEKERQPGKGSKLCIKKVKFAPRGGLAARCEQGSALWDLAVAPPEPRPQGALPRAGKHRNPKSFSPRSSLCNTKSKIKKLQFKN